VAIKGLSDFDIAIFNAVGLTQRRTASNTLTS